MTRRAMENAAACPEEPEVVVELSLGGDGRARAASGMALVDGDSGSEPVHVFDFGRVHATEELPGVGGETFDETALTFGEESVEGECGFAGATDARNDSETLFGDGDRDVLEVVFAGAGDLDGAGIGRRWMV